MAKARRVVADQNSAELDALRRSYNSLLIILEGLAGQVADTTLTAEAAWEALGDAISSGVDANSGRLVYGVRPTPTHPARGQVEKANLLVDMDEQSKF